ncbi:MAG: hypothetical protein JSV08_09440 [Acidobacteriota bacterium]|nr:MAG: hypothetical protein JSV08_09440 [Acidobacteriota bacterium]
MIETIKKFAGWWHYTDNMWLIATDKSPTEIYETFSSHLSGKEKDMVLIIEVGKNFYGLLPQEAWEWLEDYVPE